MGPLESLLPYVALSEEDYSNAFEAFMVGYELADTEEGSATLAESSGSGLALVEQANATKADDTLGLSLEAGVPAPSVEFPAPHPAVSNVVESAVACVVVNSDANESTHELQAGATDTEGGALSTISNAPAQPTVALESSTVKQDKVALKHSARKSQKENAAPGESTKPPSTRGPAQNVYAASSAQKAKNSAPISGGAVHNTVTQAPAALEHTANDNIGVTTVVGLPSLPAPASKPAPHLASAENPTFSVTSGEEPETPTASATESAPTMAPAAASMHPEAAVPKGTAKGKPKKKDNGKGEGKGKARAPDGPWLDRNAGGSSMTAIWKVNTPNLNAEHKPELLLEGSSRDATAGRSVAQAKRKRAEDEDAETEADKSGVNPFECRCVDRVNEKDGQPCLRQFARIDAEFWDHLWDDHIIGKRLPHSDRKIRCPYKACGLPLLNQKKSLCKHYASQHSVNGRIVLCTKDDCLAVVEKGVCRKHIKRPRTLN
ncbi:hypothetical protein DFP72DRAFT_1078770 [Ephemerocybe angulata]|uniref:Uncharacterized protein n=1 Tax=Ephemerocybe angulata TaxID=980116 RepID=A0A8H6LVP4_9AGAR|nr:hypothetical protein DFP72DRAFT_1078770 [Tulosesus angulatus]